MLAVVPVKGPNGAKSRLAPALAPEERAALVRMMLARVLAACADSSAITRTLLVTPDPAMAPPGVETLVDAGTGHAAAVAQALADPRARAGAVVVMADCPLATAESLDALVRAARPLAIAPASDGGMNAVALRSPQVAPLAFGRPLAATLGLARAAGIEPALVADPLLALDVDRPEDYRRMLERL